METVEWQNWKFQKKITEHKTCHSDTIKQSSVLCSPLSPSPEAIHLTPTKDRQRPEAFAFTFNQRKRKKTSQRESSGIGWLKEGTGEGQPAWD